MAIEFEVIEGNGEKNRDQGIRWNEPEAYSVQQAKIRVVGVGGGGGNALNTMIEYGLAGVDFIDTNTDIQALHNSRASMKIQLGKKITKGLGSGGDPEVGRRSAMENRECLRTALDGADMVFVTAGMGGGTGTGGAPVIANMARESGALTVGVVTKPFCFEGKVRMRQAEEGIRLLQRSVDTLITIPNHRLLSVVTRKTSLQDAFKKADEVLHNAVKGISDTITVPGLINLDFADVRNIMSEMGMAMMGEGVGTGENRAVDAAIRAISSPLLEDISIEGARGILVNITAGNDLSLFEVQEAISLILESAHTELNLIFGAVIDEKLEEEIRITVIATGIGRTDRLIKPEPDILRPKPPLKDREGSAENEKGKIFSIPRRNNEAEFLRTRKTRGVPTGNRQIRTPKNLDEPTFMRESF